MNQRAESICGLDRGPVPVFEVKPKAVAKPVAQEAIERIASDNNFPSRQWRREFQKSRNASAVSTRPDAIGNSTSRRRTKPLRGSTRWRMTGGYRYARCWSRRLTRWKTVIGSRAQTQAGRCRNEHTSFYRCPRRLCEHQAFRDHADPKRAPQRCGKTLVFGMATTLLFPVTSPGTFNS